MNENTAAKNKFLLPDNVVSRADISRLVRELETLDAELTAMAVRAGVGVAGQTAPRLSEGLAAFLTLNKLDLKDSHRRGELVESLRKLKDHVPIVHLTFAGTADQESLAKLVSWLRKSVDSQAVIEVGLQPDLVAGVLVRTENKILDLSLRNAMRGHTSALVKQLEALGG